MTHVDNFWLYGDFFFNILQTQHLLNSPFTLMARWAMINIFRRSSITHSKLKSIRWVKATLWKEFSSTSIPMLGCLLAAHNNKSGVICTFYSGLLETVKICWHSHHTFKNLDRNDTLPLYEFLLNISARFINIFDVVVMGLRRPSDQIILY